MTYSYFRMSARVATMNNLDWMFNHLEALKIPCGITYDGKTYALWRTGKEAKPEVDGTKKPNSERIKGEVVKYCHGFKYTKDVAITQMIGGSNG